MWWRGPDGYTEAEIDAAVSSGDIGRECEAFLTGTYREYTVDLGLPVPSWAWLNRLAHGSEADLRGIADEVLPGGTPQSMVQQIARHTLILIRDRGLTLPDLQRQTLIPLELALAGSRNRACPLNASELGRAITEALSKGVRPLRHRFGPPR